MKLTAGRWEMNVDVLCDFFWSNCNYDNCSEGVVLSDHIVEKFNLATEEFALVRENLPEEMLTNLVSECGIKVRQRVKRRHVSG